jgi:hypothetical protein
MQNIRHCITAMHNVSGGMSRFEKMNIIAGEFPTSKGFVKGQWAVGLKKNKSVNYWQNYIMYMNARLGGGHTSR